MAPLKILIIGSSIAGPTLATLLLLTSLPAPLKPHITILERSSSPRKEGQNIDIRGAGVTVIRHLGLSARIRAATTGEAGVRFVDKRNAAWAEFAADRTGRTPTPTADVEILRGMLAGILAARCGEVSARVRARGGKGVEWRYGDYLDRIEQQDGERVTVRFAKSGETARFDLLVGADGLQSLTRRMVWGEEAEEVHMRKLAGEVHASFFSMPAGQTDGMYRRWFHAPGRKGVMVRPAEHRDRVTVFMCVIDDRGGSVPKGRESVQAQKALMRDYFAGEGWECERIVKAMMETDDFYYEMLGQVKMDSWSKGRVVLLGDAGYCASPFSGMGTTLAMVGAWNLAGMILRHPGDHVAAFQAYEEQMRPAVVRAQKLAPGMPKLFHPEKPWGVWMLNVFVFLLVKSGVFALLMKLGAGPPAGLVAVKDYGFERLEEME